MLHDKPKAVLQAAVQTAADAAIIAGDAAHKNGMSPEMGKLAEAIAIGTVAAKKTVEIEN